MYSAVRAAVSCRRCSPSTTTGPSSPWPSPAPHLTALDAARLLGYRALWKRDRNEPHAAEAAMAKLFAGRTGVAAVHAALLLHGHYGYTTEAPFEQRLRDLIGLEIGDGTPEIMKGIIAREAYGRAFTAYR